MLLFNSEALHMLFPLLEPPFDPPLSPSLQVTSSRNPSLLPLTMGCVPLL